MTPDCGNRGHAGTGKSDSSRSQRVFRPGKEVSSAETLLRIVQRAKEDLLHVEEYLARRHHRSLTETAEAQEAR